MKIETCVLGILMAIGWLGCQAERGDAAGVVGSSDDMNIAAPVPASAPSAAVPASTPSAAVPAATPSTAVPAAAPFGRAALAQDTIVPSTGRITLDLPRSALVAARRTFTAKLAASSFGETTEGGGVNLTFDPTVVRVVNVAVDAKTWEFFTSAGTVDNVRGAVDDITFASFEGRSGEIPIATVTFESISAGNPSLRVSESTRNQFASGGHRLAVQFE